MPKRLTKKVTYVRLPEHRINEIQALVASWPYETKAFMRARLNQYKPPRIWLSSLAEWGLTFFMDSPEKTFRVLKDPAILTDWQKRFELSGQANPQDAWNRILEKEVTSRDYLYLLSLLDESLTDVHVPIELENLFEKVYRAHIRKEYVSDPVVPKAPLLLVVGPSGSGKTSTVTEAIEKVIFSDQVLPEIDLNLKKEELLADEPFWKSLEEVDPTLAMEMVRLKRLKFYKRLGRIPLIRWIFKRQINRNLSILEEQGIQVDYAMITPNDYQTALAGEPGNYFKRALGDARKTTIRHVEEAHSAFGRVEGHASGAERQQRTLIDTSNIVIDEIISGKRDCLLVATTDQPERFDAAIYRRFVEKGKIINLADFWKNPSNLREVVRLELQRHDIAVQTAGRPVRPAPDRPAPITQADLDRAVELIYQVFKERTLKVIPSYVRKLVHSIVEIKSGFTTTYLQDPFLVRNAFELVAQNSYGDLYKRIVDRMDRHVRWEEYVGGIKDIFSEMTNNCLYYGVDEEKGVVLNGPPGSGKTFLVRTWLGENKEVHDIATSAAALQDPVNPIDGAVENMEKLYDIAKMIAPTVVFFDEGDALAPKRSASGGSPADKLTNKFLSLIDGEIPLRRVFTVLTTNRLDIIDPALIRSKRLKVLEISGMMSKDDIEGIVAISLENIPLTDELSVKTIIESAQGLCNTPADYAAFVEKAKALRSTEYEVLLRFRDMQAADEDIRVNFVKFNLKTLVGIVEAVDLPAPLRNELKAKPLKILDHFDEIKAACDRVESADAYPLTRSHLASAKAEISQSPVKKGKVQLDEFLEAELSQEPQVGFIIGVGASDTAGVLLPIATSLTYRVSSKNVLVTGAVSSPSSAAAQLDMAVQMTQQSAQEALTMVKNYLQGLDPKVSTARLLGDFLEDYTIHHQLLSASYNVGGPSAGYALAINTLSALMLIPVLNDFGITGAPWTKGVKPGEVGGSVIIGGHKKKTEKVLTYLRRMYMPLKNYMDLDQDFLMGYWSQGKDILGVTHFGDLIPEVVWLSPSYGKRLEELIHLRIQYKLAKYKSESPPQEIKERILAIKEELRGQVEKQLQERLAALRYYLRSPVRDPHLSLSEIYRHKPSRVSDWTEPVFRLIRNIKSRKSIPPEV
ncbi:AAA family ATPase [Desulfatitalea tepidiphila]|uniref:AAA family ATPase n=1 Tax=Desulfatitalea tepidiphila TaxID=1185843 RepID=UPI000978679F|nr:AAA family ATPase [Desulfatitalea tepidiphila]